MIRRDVSLITVVLAAAAGEATARAATELAGFLGDLVAAGVAVVSPPSAATA